MKNTVNLDKFVELKEKDLQEIRGGDSRISKYLRDFIFPRKK
ncbi:competence-stimulating peptide ComC [Streptococcus mitis]|nr:competence-stimulating peptide ComC [Streptococcus mitis]